MTQIIPNGGTRESQDRYVGAPNELTVDQSNRELRLHDGSKPGGYRIPNKDTLDQNYQGKSDELTGFKFAPALRGLLVRLSAGSYAIRKFIGDGGVAVDNADGYGGDITIRLGSEITQDMTFTGDVLMKKVLEVEGGVNANTFGDHTGGLDARGAKVYFDNKSIPASAIDSPAVTSPFAIGMILLWAGAANTLPQGWAICDGGNGTPDLRNRFVVGTDMASIGATGGSSSHKHVATIQPAGDHSHGADVLPFTLSEIHIPVHQHRNGVCDDAANYAMNHGVVGANPQSIESINTTNNAKGVYEGLTDFAGGGQPHDHGIMVDSAGNHTHAVTMETADNTPPYFALAYIMRIL